MIIYAFLSHIAFTLCDLAYQKTILRLHKIDQKEK